MARLAVAGPASFAEMDYDTGHLRVVSPDGRIVLECESSGIGVRASDTEPGTTADTGTR